MKKFYCLLLLIIFSVTIYGCDNNSPIKPPINLGDPDTEEPIDNKYYDYATEVLLIDEEKDYIELLNCPVTQLKKDVKVFKLNNGILEDSSLDQLLIGMNNVYVRTKNKVIEQIIIDGEAVFPKIRIAIRKSISNIADISTLFHDSITIQVYNQTILKTYDNSQKYQIEAGIYTFICAGGMVGFWVNNILYQFDKRIIIEDSGTEMRVTSISRGVGIPSYAGNLEISVVENKLLLINDVAMENYLVKVVPSEMPASWNKEALKAQAVSARTYAYREIINRKFPTFGYVVDDSESSQVYNNQAQAISTTEAVNETKGMTMFYDNQVIVSYYYSGTSGLTGSGHEVWIEAQEIEPIPYLIGQNLTKNKDGSVLNVDTGDENSVLAFFKKIEMISPGGNSNNHRWVTSFTKTQLRTTINTNLPMMTKTYPRSYPILDNGQWVIKDFPPDIGEIQNIYVSKRGESGVVVSLTIEASNVTFKIINQYNIRFTIRPKDAGSTVQTSMARSTSSSYTSSSNNDSILKSGYFALEWMGNTLNFYGGGSGHGVGMCQYSANYYAAEGLNYQTILQKFYTGISFENTSVSYTPLVDFSKYFKNV